MKIRNKVLITISITWFLFLSIIYFGSHHFLLKTFLNIEQTQANEDLSRVDEALTQINHSLLTFTSDWGHWNDFYNYMKAKNPKFISNNLYINTFVNSDINLLTIWNNRGKRLFSESVDTHEQKIVNYPSGIEHYLHRDSNLLHQDGSHRDRSGYILTSKGIMIIASAAATGGNETLPPLGRIVVGRNLDATLVKKISETTKLDLNLYTISDIKKSDQLSRIFDIASKNIHGHYNQPVSDNLLEGFSIIRDVDQRPIGMFRIQTRRSIFATGVREAHYYLVTLILLGVFFTSLIIWLLHKVIVKRLEQLDDQLASISINKSIHQRVIPVGNDEISTLSTEVNHLLDIIQTSHQQLEERVCERTAELQQANSLLQQEIIERKSIESELTKHKETLVKLAHYDNLTNLPNRVYFNELLNQAIKKAKHTHTILAVLFIDLDRFKNINDAFGHSMGDLVLQEISTRLASILPKRDVIARLGGDEFMILLNSLTNREQAGPIADRIIKACSQAINIDAHEFFITASVGISIYPENGESLEDLQKCADIAMYKAKKSGNGMHLFYSHEMNMLVQEHIKLEAELRRAIQHIEFALYCQPQLNLSDGSIQRVEALIRWEHPTLGLIAPMKFIPLAEETGLIMQIGEWALHEACRIHQQWRSYGYGPICISVNISAKQFRHQDLTNIISHALSQQNMDPKYLEIEITESAVMEDVENTITKLKDIRSLGVRISIDDFGTGYTSINYLHQFPVSILKIDQTFTKGIPHSANDIAIINAVIALGHNLGLEIIAEGVETKEQMEFLASHYCDFIQGYFISPPLPADKFIQQFGTHLKAPGKPISTV